MANRVFAILGEWVSLDDAKLSAAIAKIEDSASARAACPARRLFARAIETPGGLKIQTIHAFCERVLHLFPFEANVAARFEVLDDATAAESSPRREARFDAGGAASDWCGGRALDLVGEVAARLTVDTLMQEALKLKAAARARRTAPTASPWRCAACATSSASRLARRRRISERAIVGKRLRPTEWRSIAAALRTSKARPSRAMLTSLDAAAAATDAETRFESYVCMF